MPVQPPHTGLIKIIAVLAHLKPSQMTAQEPAEIVLTIVTLASMVTPVKSVTPDGTSKLTELASKIANPEKEKTQLIASLAHLATATNVLLTLA
jgi:hypothetical protein